MSVLDIAALIVLYLVAGTGVALALLGDARDRTPGQDPPAFP
jgi:hypothetical protein